MSKKRKLKFSNRTRIVRLNPQTLEFLRNNEVACRRCNLNFGDENALMMHRTEMGAAESICLSPKSIGLKSTRNFAGTTVWRYIDE